jgi:mevalonate kinase
MVKAQNSIYMNQSSQQSITMEIPGRICLMGDKVDLLGFPVIAAAIDCTLTLNIKRLDKPIIRLFSKNFGKWLEYSLGEKGDWNHEYRYWCAVAYRLKDKIGGFEAEFDSHIPIGSGLSSSAAVSVGLAKALNKLFNIGLTNDEIAEIAYRAEHNDIGVMCGRMDQYAIAHGGVTFIETGEIPKVEKLQVDSLPVVVGDTQEERLAKQILNSIKERLNKNDPIVHDAFNVMKVCVLEGKKAIENRDFVTLGEYMNIQQEQENIIGAATPKLNALCEAAMEAGALGAKQMGAGGGGCMVAVCPGYQEEVAKAIECAGGKAWIFNIFEYCD